MDDKFIMMNMDDDRSKEIAEIIGNKTCKKIIDYLAEVKDASENDISKALGIPLNTTEYNLNKLVKSCLVEKTKNFFWSVKGRKIDMYKLAKKHIVISPKSKLNMEKLKSVIPAILIGAIFLIAVFGIWYYNSNNSPVVLTNKNYSNEKLMQFNSFDDLKSFLKTNIGENSGRGGLYSESMINSAAPTAGTNLKSSTQDSASHSTTNVQVEGVDEADIVKNDGKYIYTISGNKVVIVNAYPADKMEVVSSINFSSPRNIFINDDKLVVFGDGYRTIDAVSDSSVNSKVMCTGYRCGGYSESITNVYIYNVKDRKNPVLEKNISLDGNYAESRMIGNYVYSISSKYIYNYDSIMPMYEVNGVKSSIPIRDIYYFDYGDTSYVFSTIGAINLDDGSLNTKVYLTAGSGNIYVSENNIYLTYTKTITISDRAKFFVDEVAFKLLPDSEKEKVEVILKGNSYYDKLSQIRKVIFDYSMVLSGSEKEEFDNKYLDLSKNFETNINKKIENTIVHKININGNKINYETAGEASGHVLNQFSMDEFNGYFRIATTTGEVWGGNSLNNVYVLDKNLKIVGRLEDLAKGEKIYSARFVGKRAYVVTFKKIDPLFVIDLSVPSNPKVLGYLKIPGYSDYLHPYDENHIIGIGKDAADASSEDSGRNLDFAWYQGVKISLFDVSDVENPVEKAKFIIGDRGTDSPVLWDHKALLFDKDKKLLVIPVTVAEIDRSKYRVCSDEELNNYDNYNYCLRPNTYGQTVWQGAYVLNIDLNGISLRGKITHIENKTEIKYGAAKNEVIGATRIDESGNIWTKVSIVSNTYNQIYGQWVTNAIGYERVVYQDSNLDYIIGGIYYRPYYWDGAFQIQRSLYMDDILYTISPSIVKANELIGLNELNKVDLGYSQQVYNGVFY